MEKPSFHTKGTPTGKYWWTPQLIQRSKEVSAALSIISTMGRGNLQMMDALHEPTLLFLFGLKKPVEMTGQNLLVSKSGPQRATKVAARFGFTAWIISR